MVVAGRGWDARPCLAAAVAALHGSCAGPPGHHPAVPGVPWLRATRPRPTLLPSLPCRRYVFEPAAANKEEVKKAVREMRGR